MALLKRLSVTFLCCWLAGATSAQQVLPPASKKEMNVDMPDETEETDLVADGQFQLETAVLYNAYYQGKPSVVGQSLLRYGLTERVEIRALAEDGQQRDRYLSETVQATYPIALGTKIALLKNKRMLPDVTFVAYLKLPFTARSHNQEAYWSPLGLLAFQHKFASEKIKLEYNAGLQQEAFRRQWQGLGNASLHYKLTNDLEAFAEYYAQYSPREAPMHNLGGGLALQIGHQMEVYVAGGSAINTPESNHFFSGGIAVRTP